MPPNSRDLPVLADLGQGADRRTPHSPTSCEVDPAVMIGWGIAPRPQWEYLCTTPAVEIGCEVRASDSSNAQLLLHRASINNNFVSENGTVAVFGDENQFVRSDMWKINGPSYRVGAYRSIAGR